MFEFKDASELTEDMLIDWACGAWQDTIIIDRKWVVVDFGFMTCQWEGKDAVAMWRRRKSGKDAAWNKSIMRWRLMGGYYNKSGSRSGAKSNKLKMPDSWVRFWAGEYYFGEAELDEMVSQEKVQVLDKKGLLVPAFVEWAAKITGVAVYANGDELLFLGAVKHVVDDAMARFIGYVKYGFVSK